MSQTISKKKQRSQRKTDNATEVEGIKAPFQSEFDRFAGATPAGRADLSGELAKLFDNLSVDFRKVQKNRSVHHMKQDLHTLYIRSGQTLCRGLDAGVMHGIGGGTTFYSRDFDLRPLCPTIKALYDDLEQGNVKRSLEFLAKFQKGSKEDRTSMALLLRLALEQKVDRRSIFGWVWAWALMHWSTDKFGDFYDKLPSHTRDVFCRTITTYRSGAVIADRGNLFTAPGDNESVEDRIKLHVARANISDQACGLLSDALKERAEVDRRVSRQDVGDGISSVTEEPGLVHSNLTEQVKTEAVEIPTMKWERLAIPVLGNAKTSTDKRLKIEQIAELLGCDSDNSKLKEALSQMNKRGEVENTYRENGKAGYFLSDTGWKIFQALSP